MTPTEVIAIRDDAPPDNNCKKTICDAPPNIIKDVAYVMIGSKPNSIPIAPKIIPKGITESKCGDTSRKPVLKI
tara:strand:- start:352 stop:573 length:222 start_codon:yes stop_codon:yes gene_type:complete